MGAAGVGPRLCDVLRPLLAVLVVASALTGCSGCDEPAPGASASPVASAPPPTSAPASPQPPTTGPAAALEGYARASVLAPEDMPGYDARPPQPDDPAERQFDKAFAECARVVPPEGAFAEAESADYERAAEVGKGQVTSEAVVLPDAATARSDLDALRSPAAVACLRKTLVEQPDGPGPQVQVGRLSPATPPGADGVFGFVVTAPGSPDGPPLRIERVGAVVGTVRLTLLTFAFDEAVPAAERDRLLAAVVRRSAAAQQR